ncbi:hypothetical protein IFM89_006034 [Coptis chinensis]|uniref:Uncharacterized protein n=1 Tax=Coptis chinensis TaxID=261450 RepID=A0A835LX01_9MAGN|nr:hypothetical protein IFM89_006034 [Coptis chinensis]
MFNFSLTILYPAVSALQIELENIYEVIIAAVANGLLKLEKYEEVDLITKGGNYGWPVYEGYSLYKVPIGNTSISSSNFISPVLVYSHSDVNKNEASASIIGDYFYRSLTDPCMNGRYIYADLYAKYMYVICILCCHVSVCKGSTLTDVGDALSAMYIPCNEYGSKFLNPLQVVCGVAHTIIVAHNGYGLWASGTGRSGGLGSDNPANSYAPCSVLWLTVDEDFQDALEFAGEETRIQDEEPRRLAEIDKKLSLPMEEI